MELLPAFARQRVHNATFEGIEAIVASAFAIDVATLQSPTRRQAICWPRQVAMSLMREMTARPYGEIAAFYHLDHGTVIHAERKVGEMAGLYPKLAVAIDKIREDILKALE